MSGPSDGQPDWEAHRNIIEDLYWNHDKELPEVMKTMESVHGFVATKKMYKKHFKDWGLAKNLTTEESIAMISIAKKRREVDNKETIFTRRGRRVEPGKLRRFEKRHGAAGSFYDAQVATPPNITYRTPEPEPNHSLPPALPLPYPDQEMSEGEPETTQDSPGSHSFDSDGSPLTHHMPWPGAMSSWPAEDAYRVEQRPNSPGMAAQFITDAFSADVSHGLPRANMGTAGFPLHAWLASEYPQAAADGTPSWGFGWQESQHSNVDHSFLGPHGFAIQSPGPAQELSRIPDTALAVLDHAPLHNAVVYNDLDTVAALLERHANPNCATRGGMTPLHYAAYQRNVDIVRLLLNHKANLDAVTDRGRSVLFFALRNQDHVGDSDMLAYANLNHTGGATYTDEETVRVVDALFNSPTRWARLLHSIKKADKDGVTPLMVAAGEGFQNTATMLLKRGAQPEVRDHANHTALKYAARNNHRDLIRLLLLADPAVSSDCDLSHILKLASKNFTARTTTDPVHGEGGMAYLWDSCHKFTSALVAEEMAQLCHELGVLDDLIRLAEQRRKANVLELLLDAKRKLGLYRSGSRDSGP
ncbi:ankyrin repeat-containing domain protein [Staphylotrichum tortipilum]|uniref:Ankyrin repeat-containing domain protein n=1 Tax=Staphylotrichum tortipilum TaxID=2831512 RepID=A0AAN6MM38_9PEZI|nr:ankyrin repeat-containing domain protein [Staphylotrichum longicolle]